MRRHSHCRNSHASPTPTLSQSGTQTLEVPEHTVFADQLLLLVARGLTDRLSSSSSSGRGNGFTDGEIATSNTGLVNRELQRWGDVVVDQTLYTDLSSGDTGGKWDQFEANKRLFKVEGKYNGEGVGGVGRAQLRASATPPDATPMPPPPHPSQRRSTPPSWT